MRSPWIFFYIFSILHNIGDKGTTNGLQESDVEVANYRTNANKAQKEIIGREKGSTPYVNYYVTSPRSHFLIETRTQPALTENVSSMASRVGNVKLQTVALHPRLGLLVPSPSDLAPVNPIAKLNYSHDPNIERPRILPFKEPFRSFKQGTNDPDKRSGHSIETSPLPQLVRKLFLLSPVRKNASNSNANFFNEGIHLGFLGVSDPKSKDSIGREQFYRFGNEKHEESPANASEDLLFSPDLETPKKGQLQRHGANYSKDEDTVRKFESPSRDEQSDDSGIIVIPKRYQAPRGGALGGENKRQLPRLKVPQENEIRLVVNLTPLETDRETADRLSLPEIEHRPSGIRANGFLSVLQQTNRLPKNLTPENIDSGIRTLALILERLQQEKKVDNTEPTFSPVIRTSIGGAKDLPRKVKIFHSFPQRSGTSTPGRPGVDYPIYSSIPRTAFDCSTQRYKGFFGDPETKCQVWHYCDLNGGQASFLCPNGTIFSQVALTCDWWFNVKCASTSQLYVLNERLYKYILPFSPSFPEDYSGPVVDRYLTAKFNEMERESKIKGQKSSTTATTTISSVLN